MKQFRFFWAVLFLMLLVGCERGCTTSRTIDEESVEMDANGSKVILNLRLVDYRNSRAINRNIFNRSVSHTYGLSVDIVYRGQEFKGVYEEGTDNPDNVDLTKELKRVQLAVSKDGNHLGIGVDQKVVNVLHFYKERLITTSVALVNPEFESPWSDLKINDFPSPRELILANIENCEFSFSDDEILSAFMDDQSASDKAHKLLLAEWPSCSSVNDYYTLDRVNKLVKNSQWKEWAIERSLEVIRSREVSTGFYNADEFYAALNSSKVSNLLDSAMLSNWGTKGSSDATEKIVDRLKNKKRPLSAASKNEILTTARRYWQEFMRTGTSNYDCEANACMKVLLASGDTLTAHTILPQILGPNLAHFDQFDMIEVVYENYTLYTPAQQRYILAQLSSVFARTNDYVRSVLFRAVEGYAGCKRLKEWKKKYENDLDFCEVPEGC